MRSTLSILGLYQYDSTIFENMVLPSSIDKNTLIENLCMELAELEILYTNPGTMKLAISAWSKKELPVWNKLAATLELEYNPISNYDRTEEWTENETGSQSESKSGSGTNTGSGTSSGTNTNSGTDTVDNKVSAYNETTLASKDQQQTTLGTSNASTGTSSTTLTTEQSEDNSSSNSRNNTRNGRAYGNIGVTTTQEMIKQERDVAIFNMMDYIIASFKRRFCLLIY